MAEFAVVRSLVQAEEMHAEGNAVVFLDLLLPVEIAVGERPVVHGGLPSIRSIPVASNQEGAALGGYLKSLVIQIRASVVANFNDDDRYNRTKQAEHRVAITVVTVLDERVARSRAGRFLGKKPGDDIDLTIANLPIERSGGILADQEVRIEASATFRNR